MVGIPEGDAANAMLAGQPHHLIGGIQGVSYSRAKMPVPLFDAPAFIFQGGNSVHFYIPFPDVLYKSRKAIDAMGVNAIDAAVGKNFRTAPCGTIPEPILDQNTHKAFLHLGRSNEYDGIP